MAPHLLRVDELQKTTLLPADAALAHRAPGAVAEGVELQSAVSNFYQTDVISRASPTLAKAAKARELAK